MSHLRAGLLDLVRVPCWAQGVDSSLIRAEARFEVAQRGKGSRLPQVAAVIDALAEDPHTLVVISSDLSHFLSYRDAQQIDAATCEHILEKSTTLSGEEACGARAINGLMASNKVRSLEVSLLHACNSGDTAGTPNRVVGYAAFALH